MSHKTQVEAKFYYLTNGKLLNICKSQYVYFLIKKKEMVHAVPKRNKNKNSNH